MTNRVWRTDTVNYGPTLCVNENRVLSHTSGNSEIIIGDVLGESLRERYAPVPHKMPLAPVSLTALCVVIVTPPPFIWRPQWRSFWTKCCPAQFGHGNISHWVKCWVPKVFDSKPGRSTDAPPWGSLWFSSDAPGQMLGSYLTLSHDHFPVHSFQFIQ